MLLYRIHLGTRTKHKKGYFVTCFLKSKLLNPFPPDPIQHAHHRPLSFEDGVFYRYP